MSVRFFVTSVERVNSYRGPMHFFWRFNQTGINCPYGWQFYGLVDWSIVAADVTPEQLGILQGFSDVLVIPANIDATLTASAVTVARDYLETAHIPTAWVTTADTYRGVLRSVCGIFAYMGRVTTILHAPFPFETVSLNTTFGELPGEIRTAMTAAADRFLLDYSKVRNTTTLRTILKNMADQFTNTVYDFKVTTL
jgi:hypothetical protein